MYNVMKMSPYLVYFQSIMSMISLQGVTSYGLVQAKVSLLAATGVQK